MYFNRTERYKQQKRGAKRRDIPWLFTYITWWRTWCESGKWQKRGTKRGQYVMSRPGDKGPYAPWDVRVVKVEKNISEALIGNKRGLGNKNRLGKKFSPESLLLISKASKERASKRTRNVNGQFV